MRVLVEGAEETGSDDVNHWVAADERGADCVIAFDAGMLDPETPALTVGTRGMVFASLEVRTGERPVHSGLYGGAALNAFHALHAALAAVLPGADGRLPEELRAGIEPPTPDELATWDALPDGARVLGDAGARPADPTAAAEFHTRTMADAALDVHRIHGGEARTIVPPVASCDLSVRLAPGQDPQEIAGALEALVRAALPEGAELELSTTLASPSLFDPASAPLRIARGALARVCGREPVLLRVGRHAADPRVVRRPRHPGDRVRLRPAGGQLPRARRVVHARRPRARPARGAGAVRGPRCGSGARRLTKRIQSPDHLAAVAAGTR